MLETAVSLRWKMTFHLWNKVRLNIAVNVDMACSKEEPIISYIPTHCIYDSNRPNVYNVLDYCRNKRIYMVHSVNETLGDIVIVSKLKPSNARNCRVLKRFRMELRVNWRTPMVTNIDDLMRTASLIRWRFK